MCREGLKKTREPWEGVKRYREDLELWEEIERSREDSTAAGGVERSREELRAVGSVFALMIGGQRRFFIKIQR